jgi:hypothetical protein
MPHEFWSLTPGEFMELVEGYKWRNERDWEKVAQLAAWITAPHLKKPTTARKLLGKDKDKKARRKVSSNEKRDELASLKRDMGVK